MTGNVWKCIFPFPFSLFSFLYIFVCSQTATQVVFIHIRMSSCIRFTLLSFYFAHHIDRDTLTSSQKLSERERERESERKVEETKSTSFNIKHEYTTTRIFVSFRDMLCF